jgi:pyruvate dehydrogenase E1 component alpha subunit
MVVNNQFGMGTALERHSAVTDLSRKAAGYGVPGSRCDGMDVLDVQRVVGAALAKARDEREPQLVEAVTYRYRGHSMADPEEYRTKDEVERWRERDPLLTFPARLVADSVLEDDDVKRLDGDAVAAVDAAVEFAERSPFPDLASLYDDIYVIGEQVRAPWWSTDSRSPDVHRGEEEREAGEVARELAEAGAAYDDDTDPELREARARGEGG